MARSAALRRFRYWANQVAMYRRESRRLRDFISLMRVRLSQTRIAPWVTPVPIVADVDLLTLGPGVRLRSHTTDMSVFTEITRGNTLGGLPPGLDVETVIDLGANIGLSYRWLRARYPAARFVCVEPDPGNLEMLKANVRAVDGACEIIGACIGGHARRVKMATSIGEWGFRLSEVDDPTDADTEVVTMDQLLAKTAVESIDLLKCDIEGAERELFADCASWIGRVENLIVECHTDVISTDELMDTIASNGGKFDLILLEHPAFDCELATLTRSRRAAASLTS